MSEELRSFFELYVKAGSGRKLTSESFEFRYAVAALLIACSKSDHEEDPDEEEIIADILSGAFELTGETLDELMRFADVATREGGVGELTALVNDYFIDEDKHELLDNLWRVALADGRVDDFEASFISDVAQMIEMDESALSSAKASAEQTAIDSPGNPGVSQ